MMMKIGVAVGSILLCWSASVVMSFSPQPSRGVIIKIRQLINYNGSINNTLLFAEAESDNDNNDSDSGAQDQPLQPPPPPAAKSATPPPAVKQPRLDPLIASLTRVDAAAEDTPTTNIPFIGEIPLDGSLVVLIPTALIGILGIILSIYIAFQSQDAILESVLQVGDGMSKAASEQANQSYDPNVCRGLCGAQEQEVDGLRRFMESLRKD